ncbi:MAG: hypothetical protein MI757_03620 [Pirellulales bacterium]|nr:hypothetical protein [Pirellulales bacterium]
MPYSDYSTQYVVSRGEVIYMDQLREKLEPGNFGKFLVIDIETGEYEIDESDLAATERALAKHENPVLYGRRIGYPTAYRIGGLIRGEN